MPMQMEVVGWGLDSHALNVSWNTEATMRPTAVELRPGRARRYTWNFLRSDRMHGAAACRSETRPMAPPPPSAGVH